MADGVDTSIYGQIKQPDPMGSLKSIIDLSTGVTNNKLKQLELLGKVTGGQILQESLDPETGQFDINKFISNLKNNPKGYAAAPEVLPQGLTAAGTQISNKTGQQNLAQAGFNNLGAIWGSRLSRTTGPVSRDDLIGDVVDGVAQGRIPPDLGKAVMAGIRTVPDAEVRSYAAGGWVQSLPPGTAAGAAPAPPNAAGAETKQTTGQFATQAVGGDKPASDVPPVAASGASPGAAAAPGATAAPPVAPVAPKPAPVAAPAASKGVVTGLAPGVAEAKTAVAQNSAGLFNNITTFASNYGDRMGALKNMETDAATIGRQGPLTPELIKWGAGVNQLFGTSIALDKIAASERFNKLAEQLILQQTALLHGTDLTTMTAKGANPSLSLSSLGSGQIVSMLKGNEDALLAKSKAAIAWKRTHGPESFEEFNADFLTKYDQRVFQSVYMTQKDRDAMFASMSAAEQADFRSKYNQSVKDGWIPDPRGK